MACRDFGGSWRGRPQGKSLEAVAQGTVGNAFMSITSLHRMAWPLVFMGLWVALVLQVGLAWWASRLSAPGWQAHAREWGRSWWRELQWAYRVLLWWQPFRAQAIPDGCPAKAETQNDKTGVVLVHGYLCNRGFWTPWMQRLASEGRPFVALTLDPPWAPIEAHAPALDAAVQKLQSLTGRAPLIVAHSMGGLVFRAWARAVGPQWGRCVGGVVTLATPHQGTWLARWSLTPNGRQMRPDSPWLADLAHSESGSIPVPVDAWLTVCDAVVFPAQAAVWPGASTHILRAEGHVSMAFAPEVWSQVRARLDALDKSPPAVVFSRRLAGGSQG